jgi:hypothetical protein
VTASAADSSKNSKNLPHRDQSTQATQPRCATEGGSARLHRKGPLALLDWSDTILMNWLERVIHSNNSPGVPATHRMKASINGCQHCLAICFLYFDRKSAGQGRRAKRMLQEGCGCGVCFRLATVRVTGMCTSSNDKRMEDDAQIRQHKLEQGLVFLFSRCCTSWKCLGR